MGIHKAGKDHQAPGIDDFFRFNRHVICEQCNNFPVSDSNFTLECSLRIHYNTVLDHQVKQQDHPVF